MNFKEKYYLFESDEEKVSQLSEAFSPFLSKLLFARGLEEKKDAEEFLDISWKKMLDPFLFNQMQKAVDRILKAVKNNQKILIFSDYDADGVPGAVVLYDFFKKINYENFSNFIPDRNKDGFGLSLKFVERFKKDEIDLIITIDCGITDVEAAEELKNNNIDLIITDHHKEGEKKPEAFAIINHQVVGEKYPEKYLSGAGVVFKLVQALIFEGKKKEISEFLEIKNGWEKWLLDMVGVATICDMVPLKGENRIIAHFAKEVIGKSFRDGLLAILSAGGMNQKKLSCTDIAFTIGPRINAAGRLEHPNIAFNALSKRGVEGINFAKDLERINRKRKTLTAKFVQEAFLELEKREIGKVIVIGDKNWPLGIVGLIASKIVEKYDRPAFVWSEFNQELAKGSVRSNGEVSIHSLMEKVKDSFTHFGGHEMAGGFEINSENLKFLEENLNQKYSEAKKIKRELSKIDLKISIDDVTQEKMDEIKKLSPFGMGNPNPKFLLENVEISDIRIFGKNSEHLELMFKNSDGKIITGIRFFFTDSLEKTEFKIGEKINLVVLFEENNFLGNTQLKLKIEDVY